MVHMIEECCSNLPQGPFFNYQMNAEIIDRYMEQLSTTAETLRRRGVAAYDGIFYIGNKCVTATQRVIDVAEPVTLDMVDYTTNAVKDAEPMETIEKDTKNTIVESYLGISVLLIGLSCGQIAGALALPALLEKIFDSYVEWAVLTLIPTYIYLTLKKNAMDDVERRSTLFGFAVFFGIFAGHKFGAALISMAPTTFFVPPLVLALSIDNEILPSPLVSLDRHSFFYISGAISVLLSTAAGLIPLGYFSTGLFILSILHTAFLLVHFQVMMQFIKEKVFNVADAQFSYICSIFVIQLLATALFGSSVQMTETVASQEVNPATL